MIPPWFRFNKVYDVEYLAQANSLVRGNYFSVAAATSAIDLNCLRFDIF